MAHLVGFVVPWKLMSTPEMPYRTTILAGMIDVGDVSIRLLGVVWLMAAVAFVALGGAVLAGGSVRVLMFALLRTPSPAAHPLWSRREARDARSQRGRSASRKAS